jgi:adenosylmethionine-8-amino-7-oxononanoate aminotransferase
MGKTGTMHAWEQDGIDGPDIQMIGKALGGGFVPLSGVLLRQKVFDGIAAGTQVLAHGHTFQAHPTACAAALAVQRIIKRDGVLNNVKAMGRFLESELRQQLGRLPYVGDIRGRGLFWAVEFILDTTTETPFPREHNFSNRIVEVAAELGLNVLGNLGKTGELDVELVIISPPYIVSKTEVECIVDLLKNVIEIVTDEYESQYCRPSKRVHGLVGGRL